MITTRAKPSVSWISTCVPFTWVGSGLGGSTITQNAAAGPGADSNATTTKPIANTNRAAFKRHLRGGLCVNQRTMERPDNQENDEQHGPENQKQYEQAGVVHGEEQRRDRECGA